MTKKPDIRETQPNDLKVLEALYPAAFPEENLLPVLRKLHAGRSDVLSLVFEDEGQICGNIVFSTCGTEEYPIKFSMLAPLAVAPDRQQQSIGSQLVKHGLKLLSEHAFATVFVLGDPNYYGRFGFMPERAVMPPYDLPPEWADAWQSLDLSDEPIRASGKLIVPEPWQDPVLWAE